MRIKEAHTGIVHEDIEPLLLSSEGLDRGLDGGEVREIEI